ncbi:4'-phosphopantetheinyl transferase family protein [Chryseobacterium sp. G0201]|uniref:4'-phosphopantetheinyl transferase family protein n=1 Tax=Chryseobacterium sp. G0201 TaxID=2487065 RepID=UPI000F507BDB|nr:4'-phosphopantetheinyl transferase superfamily protein [Chryseobacterium sp. G0201]AZA54602.1 4'-phosphopantetheinyl transferase superfamily protein [Chryseobacterium sp. G0201]
MIVLYTFINEFKHKHLLDKYLHVFCEDFQNKIQKHRRWQDAQLSLLGRVLLNYGLSNYYYINETNIHLSTDNKPFLKEQNIHFNISHSNNLVVCAIGDFPIGIDVEFLDEKIDYLDFQSQMTIVEFYEIHHSRDKTKSLFTYWTKKEAVIKADGRGLQIPLDSFEVLKNECLIDNEKFFVKEIFIHKNFVSHIASNNIDILNKTILFEEFYY